MNSSIRNDEIIVLLLQKYIDNKCSKAELRIILNWLKSSENSQDFEFVSQNLWEKLDRQTSFPDEKRQKILNTEVDILLQHIKSKNTHIIQPTNTPPSSRRIWIYRVAVIFLLMLSFGAGFYLLKDKSGPVTYKEIYTNRGETKEYTLDDGTHIILNAESKVVIPSNYNQKNRHIEMTGEGFFDVAPNPQKPFIIKNGNTQVKVTGTSFNVKSYDEDDYINVTVSTGTVLVNVASQDLQLRVTPMEHLSIHKESGNLTKLSLSENKHINWIDGCLFFDKEPIREVIRTINRRYNSNVILRCKNYATKRISGTHDNKSLEAVIESICHTAELKHKKDGENIILYE